YDRPATRFVADFIGATSLLPGTVTGRDDGLVRVRIDGGIEVQARAEPRWQPGQRVLLAVRAERVRVQAGGEESGNVVPGTVRSHVYLGSHYQYLVDTPAGPLRMESPVEIGDGAVRLCLPPEALVVLEEES
ncbi:MAG: TOBE domain-containing protein, partial [Thermomicrobiaceae bacterium]|nr:TOBE domain-containing protein [Thermomicrobiaceae bacterium]